MSTRSAILFEDKDTGIKKAINFHYDGYPTHAGVQLMKYFNDKETVKHFFDKTKMNYGSSYLMPHLFFEKDLIRHKDGSKPYVVTDLETEYRLDYEYLYTYKFDTKKNQYVWLVTDGDNKELELVEAIKKDFMEKNFEENSDINDIKAKYDELMKNIKVIAENYKKDKSGSLDDYVQAYYAYKFDIKEHKKGVGYSLYSKEEVDKNLKENSFTAKDIAYLLLTDLEWSFRRKFGGETEIIVPKNFMNNFIKTCELFNEKLHENYDKLLSTFGIEGIKERIYAIADYMDNSLKYATNDNYHIMSKDSMKDFFESLKREILFLTDTNCIDDVIELKNSLTNGLCIGEELSNKSNSNGYNTKMCFYYYDTRIKDFRQIDDNLYSALGMSSNNDTVTRGGCGYSKTLHVFESLVYSSYEKLVEKISNKDELDIANKNDRNKIYENSNMQEARRVFDIVKEKIEAKEPKHTQKPNSKQR